MSKIVQRTQSAPDVGARPAHQFQKKAAERPHAPRRTKTSIDFFASPVQPSPTPRLEREDPFNLGGFFPSHLREEEQEWSWLRYGEEDEEEREEALEVVVEEAPSRQSLFNQGEEATTGAAIQREDKLGILTILDSMTPEPEAYPVDDRLYSPYAEDEACNEESLYQAYGARRAATSVKVSGSGTPFGELFLGRDEDTEEGRGVWGLTAALETLAGGL